jgi:hypothetical protein
VPTREVRDSADLCVKDVFAQALPTIKEIDNMTKFRGRPGLGLILGLVLAFTAQTSHAGLLEIDLTVNGVAIAPLTATGPFDISGDPTGNTFSANILALNSLVAGFNLKFSGLAANSNNSGNLSNAYLIQSATASLIDPNGPAVTFTAMAFQTDFQLPVGANGQMTSSSSGTFTNAPPGNSQSFQSYFDPTNNPLGNILPPAIPSGSLTFLAPGIPSPQGGFLPASFGADAPSTPLGTVVAPYSIVNVATVTITGTGIDQYTGSTYIYATVIPEPASVVMVMSALPIAFGLLRRYRRNVKSFA